MWDRLKKLKDKLGLISTLLVMVFGVGLFGTVKATIGYIKKANTSINNHESVMTRINALETDYDALNGTLNDYEVIKKNVIYLMGDNDVLSGLLRANMIRMDDKDYGTVLVLYDDVLKKDVRRMVEVKMRMANGSNDLYVFVPWGTNGGVPVTRKYAAKWHEDEKKYYFIDKNGDFHLIYEVDIDKTILK